MSGTESDRRHPSRPMLAASIACFREGTVLLARRGQPPMKGVWTLPGGMVELGERAAEAAARELLEETGVVAEPVGLADLVEVILPDADGRIERHVAILAFAGRWVAGEPTAGEEAEEVAWFELDGLDGLETTPGLETVLARAAELAR